MTEEIPLGKNWKLLVDLGGKHTLVRIISPKDVLMEEQEFTKGFWRRSRKKKKFKSFLEEAFNSFEEDYDVPSFGEKEFRDIRMSLSQAWEERSKGKENEETNLPFMEEESSKKIEAASEEALKSPSLLHLVQDAIHKEQGLVGETENSLLTFFTMLSCKAEEPVNQRISGRGSTGKSTIAVATSNLFPSDMTIIVSTATRKSLYYDENLVEEIDDKNRHLDARGLVMVILEEENSQEFLDEIKALLGHDDEITDMPFAVGGGGGPPETHHLWITGWPSYVGVTTKPVEEETQSSRTLLITPNRGSNKYSSVNKRDAFEDSFPWFKHGNWRTQIVKEAIKKLDRYKVWNPLSLFVEDKFPSHKKARMMRDWDRLSSLMKTVTILFQKQRKVIEINGEEHLVAAPIDIEIALKVAENAMVEAIQGLDQDVRDFFLFLNNNNIDSIQGYKGLIKWYEKKFGEDINRTTLRERYVDKLRDRGLLEVDESGNPYVFSIASKELEQMEDLRKELGDLSSEEMEQKAKSLILERLEKGRKIKNPSLASGLQKAYDISLPDTEDDPKNLDDGGDGFGKEYVEEVEQVLKYSFSYSRSESSKIMEPLDIGDGWLNGRNSVNLESSKSSKSSGESSKSSKSSEKEAPTLGSDDEGDTPTISSGEERGQQEITEWDEQRIAEEIENKLKQKNRTADEIFSEIEIEDREKFNDIMEKLRGDLIGRVKNGNQWAHRDNVMNWRKS